METDTTRTVLEDLLDAFRTGDNDRLAARYDENINWLFHAPVSVFPFAGARRGRVEVFKGFIAMYELFRLVDYRVCVKLVDGDRAATLSESRMVQRATGRTIRSRIAGFHHFSDGRLIEYRGFVDSFDAVEQVLGRELNP